MTNQTSVSRVTRQLEILAARSLELADRVAAGQLPLIDAVDLLYEAAVWADLPNTVGDDVVQTTIGAAFINARLP
jgi:hypothetical protein